MFRINQHNISDSGCPCCQRACNSILHHNTLFRRDIQCLHGIPVNIRRRLAGKLLVITDDFLPPEPASQLQVFKIKIHTFRIGGGCNGKRYVIFLQQVEDFRNAVRQTEFLRMGQAVLLIDFPFPGNQLLLLLFSDTSSPEKIDSFRAGPSVCIAQKYPLVNPLSQRFLCQHIPCMILDLRIKQHGSVKIENNSKFLHATHHLMLHCTTSLCRLQSYFSGISASIVP